MSRDQHGHGHLPVDLRRGTWDATALCSLSWFASSMSVNFIPLAEIVDCLATCQPSILGWNGSHSHRHYEFLHEFFWFQSPSPRAPIACWIPGCDTTYSAETILEFCPAESWWRHCSCLHMQVFIRSPRHPFTLIFWRVCQPARTFVPSSARKVNRGHWAFVPDCSRLLPVMWAISFFVAW